MGALWCLYNGVRSGRCQVPILRELGLWGAGMPRVLANGRHLFYEEEGQGAPLVFLSGLGGDHRAFGVTMRHFGRTRRALALDARDVGQSDRAEAPYTTADLAD